MVWIVEKKIFYHILDLGFESVGIPVRVKFEFDVKDGRLAADSLSYDCLYNQQAIVKRYPGVNVDSLNTEIQKTIQCKIRSYLQDNGYLSEDNDTYDSNG